MERRCISVFPYKNGGYFIAMLVNTTGGYIVFMASHWMFLSFLKGFVGSHWISSTSKLSSGFPSLFFGWGNQPMVFFAASSFRNIPA